MPLYDFECSNGHRQELLVASYAARPLVLTCHCGKAAKPVIFSRTSWQFGEAKKGSAVGEAIKRVKKAGL